LRQQQTASGATGLPFDQQQYDHDKSLQMKEISIQNRQLRIISGRGTVTAITALKQSVHRCGIRHGCAWQAATVNVPDIPSFGAVQ
jgi:hypothetical protein